MLYSVSESMMDCSRATTTSGVDVTVLSLLLGIMLNLLADDRAVVILNPTDVEELATAIAFPAKSVVYDDNGTKQAVSVRHAFSFTDCQRSQQSYPVPHTNRVPPVRFATS